MSLYVAAVGVSRCRTGSSPAVRRLLALCRLDATPPPSPPPPPQQEQQQIGVAAAGFRDAALASLDSILDLAHEKLYEWHWKDVPMPWREVYQFFSQLKAIFLVLQVKRAAQDCDQQQEIQGAPPKVAKVAAEVDEAAQVAPSLLCASDAQVLRSALQTADKGIMMGCALPALASDESKAWDIYALATSLHAALLPSVAPGEKRQATPAAPYRFIPPF